jgi:predicted 3-demethylubiquinone-9 3-methyltransferase (glyoxalase superfamily)
MTPQKITPFLWFEHSAEHAAAFYCTLFKDSRVLNLTHYPEGAMGPAGSVMTVEFTLAGVRFVGLNGGPHFKLTEAFSLSVDCDDQAEVDHLWEKLTADGGSPSQCGWLKDRWGVSWQIVPRELPRLLASKESGVAPRVMAAVMKMTKMDIAALKNAAAGG